LTVGNAASVELRLNGKALGNLGEEGEVIRVDIADVRERGIKALREPLKLQTR